MARVTVGIPVYNGENYLAYAIRSVLAQSYPDWKLVITDNASTDGTQEICRRFSADDDRIEYYRYEQNRGAAWNFNEAFRKCDTEFFRWLSHDDFLEPSLLEQCMNGLDANPECVSCSTATGAIDQHGRRILDDSAEECDLYCQGLTPESERRRLALSSASGIADRYRGILLYSRRCNEIYGVIRTQTMQQTQLHPTYSGGEKVLLAEIAARGKILELPDMLFFVRWHTDRFTANSSARDQDYHMSTDRSLKFALPHQYRSALGYLGVIRRVPMPLSQRIGCLNVWLRFTLQVSKWRSIFRNTVTGTATSAEITGPTRCGRQVHALDAIRSSAPDSEASDGPTDKRPMRSSQV